MRESKITSKDLEILKNLPDFAEKINKNMQTVDNLITSQRELNSSVSSVNSSNNALRAMAHSKGKNRQTNLNDCIEIKNIVRNSVQGINGIFDKEKITENQNPLSLSYNSDLNSLRKNNNFPIIDNNKNLEKEKDKDKLLNIFKDNYKNNLNSKNYKENGYNININNDDNIYNNKDDILCNNNSLISKTNPKGKINNQKNYKFEPIEEENNLITFDMATNNISKYIH
jgi:hypothetical protein